ncbi:MAG: iron complex outermembrane receptor protein [Alteromonadaceae bacterium]|jgi:iron complex outermembrane receptor protein
MSNKIFRRSLLASSIAVVLAGSVAPSAMAADADAAAEKEIEVIQVRGIRGSTKASINAKRFATSQVDGIAAEDIGKLPDVTISDSLQRISGVQITRVAGEGGVVAIRGLPQIDTTMNGEVFLSATTIDEAGADFSNLPAQLFTGVDVYKTATSTNAAQGIAGAIDLKTRRPFDLDEGFTFAGGVEGTRGSISQENDHNLNGLVSYNAQKWGLLLSAVTSKAVLSTDYNGYFDTSEDGGIGAANANNQGWGGDSPSSATHIVPQGFAAFNKEEERQRDAFQLSFQADLGEGFELTADYFYTQQDRFNRKQGLSHNNRWATFNGYASGAPGGFTGDMFTVQPPAADLDDNPDTPDTLPPIQNWEGINKYNLESYRLQSFTQVNNNEEESQNLNLELNYDNGGALTGQVRMTRAKATAKMRHGYGEGDVLSIDHSTLATGQGQFSQGENCTNGEAIVGDNGGCYAMFAPGGIQDQFTVGVDVSGEHPAFSGFDQMVNGGGGSRSVADYMSDINSYHVGAFSSEGNTDDTGEMNTFSTKWNYTFEEGFITSVDFGVRTMERTVDHDQFTYTSNFGGGCDIAQWKAVDQYTDSAGCEGNAEAGEYLTEAGVFANGSPVMKSGDANGDGVVDNGEVIPTVAGDWVPYTILPPTRLDEHTSVSFIENLGGVKGLPGVWAIDPSNFKNPRQFHLDTFGNVARTENGGGTYDVELNEVSYFFQANFEHDIFSGNFGVKVIETDLFVKQNLVGSNLPHSGLGPDTGDNVTERSYTEYLPSFNLAANVTEDIILRAAYSQNMQALDLDAWGDGKVVGRVNDPTCDCLRVVNGTQNGNPELNPWLSENMSFSAEWYVGEASMASISFFNIEIESFTTGGTVMIDEPDDDGIRRGPWPFATQVQGEGGDVKGFELNGRVAFSDVTDVSFLSSFGLDANYTYNDSSQEAKGVLGNDLPFEGMSEDTYNLVLWFEQDGLSARVAWNQVSPRLITQGGANVGGQSLYQDTYSQIDISANYDVNENISVYLSGANVTEEFQQTYVEFKSQKAFQNLYEARYTAGVRVIF